MMNLGDVALIEISSVDKKIKESQLTTNSRINILWE